MFSSMYESFLSKALIPDNCWKGIAKIIMIMLLIFDLSVMYSFVIDFGLICISGTNQIAIEKKREKTNNIIMIER